MWPTGDGGGMITSGTGVFMDLHQIRAGWIKRGKAWLTGLAAVLAVAAGTHLVHARLSQDLTEPAAVADQIPLTQLPRQGQRVMEQIRQGGPFRYEKDGTVFGNRER